MCVELHTPHVEIDIRMNEPDIGSLVRLLSGSFSVLGKDYLPDKVASSPPPPSSQ